MEEQCFYCDDTFEDSYHHGLFIYQNEHVDKALCPHCYSEWLEGIKE